MMTLAIVLALLSMAGQGADVWSTVYFLRHPELHLEEANSFNARMQAKYPRMWWLPKVAIFAAVNGVALWAVYLGPPVAWVGFGFLVGGLAASWLYPINNLIMIRKARAKLIAGNG